MLQKCVSLHCLSMPENVPLYIGFWNITSVVCKVCTWMCEYFYEIRLLKFGKAVIIFQSLMIKLNDRLWHCRFVKCCEKQYIMWSILFSEIEIWMFCLFDNVNIITHCCWNWEYLFIYNLYDQIFFPSEINFLKFRPGCF